GRVRPTPRGSRATGLRPLRGTAIVRAAGTHAGRPRAVPALAARAGTGRLLLPRRGNRLVPARVRGGSGARPPRHLPPQPALAEGGAARPHRVRARGSAGLGPRLLRRHRRVARPGSVANGPDAG